MIENDKHPILFSYVLKEKKKKYYWILIQHYSFIIEVYSRKFTSLNNL